MQLDVGVVRRDGQWRIARLPRGARAPVGPARELPHRQDLVRRPRPRVAVPDLRYLPGSPARAQAARAMELLLAGPSTALQGAATSMLARGTAAVERRRQPGGCADRRPHPGRRPGRGRSPAARGPGGALAGRGERRARPAARRRRAAAGRPPRPDPRRRRGAGRRAGAGPAVPALVVYGGRVHQVAAGQPDTPFPGPVGNGELAVQSAASARTAGASPWWPRTARVRLMAAGPDGAAAPVGPAARG